MDPIVINVEPVHGSHARARKYCVVKLGCYGNDSFSGGNPEEVYGPFASYDEAAEFAKLCDEEYATEYRVVNFKSI